VSDFEIGAGVTLLSVRFYREMAINSKIEERLAKMLVT